MGYNALRAVCQFVNLATYEYLPVYIPTQEEKDNPVLYASNVRLVMAKALGVTKLTPHTYTDVRLFEEAIANNVEINVVYNDVKRLTGMKYEHMKQLMDRFKELDRDGDGFVSFEDLQSLLPTLQDDDEEREHKQNKGKQLPLDGDGEAPWYESADKELRKGSLMGADNPYNRNHMQEDLFNLFDSDSRGRLDFREFLLAVSVSNGLMTVKEVTELIFRSYDAGNTGFVTKAAMRDVFSRAMTPGVLDEFFADREDVGLTLDEFDERMQLMPHVMALITRPAVQW
jgi:Ca2+-binding EF-hand superfamily protein